ncbi:MAG: ABC transporter substrate-binding protein [Desulfurococcaceae archaeon]
MSKHIVTRSIHHRSLLIVVLLIPLIMYLANPLLLIAERKVTDALGREIELPDNIAVVATLSPSLTEILAALDLLDNIRACDTYSLNNVWFMNTSDILRDKGVKDLGGYWWSTVKTQDILEINPDLVLADKGAHKPLLQFFEEYGIRVLYLNGGSATSINEVYNDIYIIGSIFNKADKALEVVDEIERSFSQYLHMLDKYGGKKILIILGLWQGIWVAGKGTFIDDALTRLGLENAAKVFGWVAVSIEDLISWDPDIIIIPEMGITEKDLEEQGIMALNKPVVFLNTTETDILLRPGPLLKYLPETMYKVLTAVFAYEETPFPVTTTTLTIPSAGEEYVVTKVFTETVREFVTITEAITVPVTMVTTLTVLPTELQSETNIAVLIAVVIVGLIVGLLIGYYISLKRHR